MGEEFLTPKNIAQTLKVSCMAIHRWGKRVDLFLTELASTILLKNQI